MKVLIIEDEPLAAERLSEMIVEYESHIEIQGMLDSVKGAVAWLKRNPTPDLMFLDIQLADGLSFAIFDEVNPNCPIIFTTAYDEYAIKAFKLNSIDYLLKPLDFEELATAMDKFVKVHYKPAIPNINNGIDIEALRAMMQPKEPQYKQRFVVKKGEHLRAIPVDEILYFYSEDKVTFFKSSEGERFMINFTLGEIEGMIDPAIFFRINRTYLLRYEAINDMINYSNRRLKVKLQHATDPNILVSREKVGMFKEWLDS